MEKREIIVDLTPNPESDYYITDRSGNKMRVGRVGSRYCPTGMVKAYYDGLLNYTARDDDVYIASYPRSGTHWVFELIHMLVTGNPDVPKSYFNKCMMETAWLTSERFDAFPSPRVFASHRWVSELPKDAIRRRCKIVYLERNPKDQAVSYYHLICGLADMDYQGEWADFCDLYLRGEVPYNSWFDYTKCWRTFIQEHPDYPIYPVTFERLKENPVEEITRLSKFLECQLDQSLLSKILENTDFQKMKETKEREMLDVFAENAYKDKKPTIGHKGEAGVWKTQFTVAQSEMFDAEYKKLPVIDGK